MTDKSILFVSMSFTRRTKSRVGQFNSDLVTSKRLSVRETLLVTFRSWQGKNFARKYVLSKENVTFLVLKQFSNHYLTNFGQKSLRNCSITGFKYVRAKSHISMKAFFCIRSRLVLMTNLMTLTQTCFSLAMLGIVIPLCLLRIKHKLTSNGQLLKPRRPVEGFCQRPRSWIYKLEKRFWIISALDQLFYPLLIAPLYLLVGPWAFGYFLENSFGVLFAWGFYVNG